MKQYLKLRNVNMQLYFKDFCLDCSKIHIADLVLEAHDYTLGHHHDFYEFFVVLEGIFVHEWDGQRQQMSKGMYQVLKPQCFHRVYALETSSNRLRNIAIEKQYFESLIQPVAKLIGRKMWEVDELGTGAFEQFESKSQKLIQHYEAEFASYVVESLLMDLLLQKLYEGDEERKGPSWLQAACKKLEEGQLMEEGLQAFLTSCGKTQEHVTRVVKQYYQMTPTELINAHRLKYSCTLLTTTKESIVQIAYQCGFNSVAYFNKRFKEKYGSTPTQYRERYRKTFY